MFYCKKDILSRVYTNYVCCDEEMAYFIVLTASFKEMLPV
jgi:hypothetical protein